MGCHFPLRLSLQQQEKKCRFIFHLQMNIWKDIQYMSIMYNRIIIHTDDKGTRNTGEPNVLLRPSFYEHAYELLFIGGLQKWWVNHMFITQIDSNYNTRSIINNDKTKPKWVIAKLDINICELSFMYKHTKQIIECILIQNKWKF